MVEFSFNAEIWLYPGKSAWHFVSLPKDQAKYIKAEFGDIARGWGSLPVNVQIGGSKWKTSIFPDSKSSTYILPIKSEVRKIEKLTAGDIVTIEIEIIT